MAKVRCNVCSNEMSGVCQVKNSRIKINKSRNCKAYIYDEDKIKVKEDIPTIKVGYKQQQENRLRMKEEIKELKEKMKNGLSKKEAQDLGLVQGGSSVVPTGDAKHPMTGDLSRFITTASNKE